MNLLNNAKIIGGIGALLTLIGILIPSFGFFVAIIGFILVYYLSPLFFKKISRNAETEWIREGFKRRQQKHSNIIIKSDAEQADIQSIETDD